MILALLIVCTNPALPEPQPAVSYQRVAMLQWRVAVFPGLKRTTFNAHRPGDFIRCETKWRGETTVSYYWVTECGDGEVYAVFLTEELFNI